jgi:hypothetical protein
MKKTYRLNISLNGTDVNPYHRWGLSCNPFPQIGKYEWDAAQRILASLGGDPIQDTDYIRKKLKGFHSEFIEICCRKFEKGKYIQFYIEWSED